MIRLNKFIADAGIASRRQADLLICQGRVGVNGNTITELGIRIDPDRDLVTVDGRPIALQSGFEYLILHKPPGYLTTVSDPFGRPTVMQLLPQMKNRVYPVGRLDYDTSGLLFLTNDGDMALALAHPRHLVEKVYLAAVRGIPTEDELARLASGILLEDGKTAPAKIAINSKKNGNAIVELILREGRKRQVKRMMQAIGHPVLELKRIALGPLQLGGLAPGACRPPERVEMEALMELKRKSKQNS
jgi:23S rRNA pseudouridine2605 synthase